MPIMSNLDDTRIAAPAARADLRSAPASCGRPGDMDSNSGAAMVMVLAPANEEVFNVYVRVVRFTDVSPDGIEGVLARIKESGGPPPGISSTRLQTLFDSEHGTAVVLQHFDTAHDMAAAARVFEAMDASETPGTRTSVDTCEVKLDIAPS